MLAEVSNNINIVFYFCNIMMKKKRTRQLICCIHYWQMNIKCLDG